jgi:hypothetical protein
LSVNPLRCNFDNRLKNVEDLVTGESQTNTSSAQGEVAMKRDKAFISYSHKDKRQFGEFKMMLAPAIRNGIVEIWDDTKIMPGARWKEDIEAALRSARIAILLVSANFLDSEFIANNELPPLLSAAQKEGVTIFWIYLSSCLYEQTEIAAYQAAHDIARPLDSLKRSERLAVISETCAKLLRLVANPRQAQWKTAAQSR